MVIFVIAVVLAVVCMVSVQVIVTVLVCLIGVQVGADSPEIVNRDFTASVQVCFSVNTCSFV